MSAADHLNPRQFFTGTGVPLKPGEAVLPRSMTGAEPTYPDSPEDPRSAQYMAGTHSYLTTDPKAAVSFARDHEHGRVYQVQPTSPVKPDPEDSTGTMFMSQKPLTVVRRTRHRVVAVLIGMDSEVRSRTGQLALSTPEQLRERCCAARRTSRAQVGHSMCVPVSGASERGWSGMSGYRTLTAEPSG